MRAIAKYALCVALLGGFSHPQMAHAQTRDPGLRLNPDDPLAQLPPSDPLHAIVKTHTAPPYPKESLAAQEQGTTVMQVHLTLWGAADECTVFRSSGSARLDQAACEHIKDDWLWERPTAKGKRTGVTTRVMVKWDLGQLAPPPADTIPGPLRPIMATHTLPPYPPESVAAQEQGTTLMQVHITTFGVVDDCEVIRTSSSARLDQAACDHVKQVWRWEPPMWKGSPINIVTRVSVTWDIKTLQR